MPGAEAILSSGIKSSLAGPGTIRNAGKNDESITRKSENRATVAREIKHARGGGQLIIRDKVFSGRS